MVIDVRKLKNSGKDGCSFCFEYAADDSLITLPYASFKEPVTVTGELELAGDKVYVNGEISYVLIAPCSRCGEKTEYRGLTRFDEAFSDDPNDKEEDFILFERSGRSYENGLRYARDIVSLHDLLRKGSKGSRRRAVNRYNRIYRKRIKRGIE